MKTRASVLEVFSVSRETTAKLDTIAACLGEWATRYNLIGPKELDLLWPRHMADSLQLVDQLKGVQRIVDLGSGAGFPGLVLAAALDGVERVSLIESVGKKCRFLNAAAEAAELPARVLNQRIESIDWSSVEAGGVTARALAPLPKLLELSAPWLENGAIGVFPKGQKWEEELTAARERWIFDVEVEVSRTSAAARILTISEFRGRP